MTLTALNTDVGDDSDIKIRKASTEKFRSDSSSPLAELLRPKTLDNYIGQKHLINDDNGSIKNFVRLGYLPSMILYGPPGVGKTTIAQVLSHETGYVFVELSATDSTIGELRELLAGIVKESNKRKSSVSGYNPLKVVVFIDEIHRFTTTQQDFLLPFIEAGNFVFIGATTVDPKARIRRAILSRCQLFELNPLSKHEVQQVVVRANIYENIRRKVVHKLQFITYNQLCLDVITHYANGDNRVAINVVELISSYYFGDRYKHTKVELNASTLKETISYLTRLQSGLQDPANIPIFDTLTSAMLNEIPPTNRRTKGASNRSISYQSLTKSRATEQPLDASGVAYWSLGESMIVKIKSPKLTLRDDSEIESDFESAGPVYNGDPSDWRGRMEVSDDSDVESGCMYSEDEESIKPWNTTKISRSKFFTLQATHLVLLLLKRGESPLYIMKKLLLFLALSVDSDNLELRRILSILKALQESTSNTFKALSNCVERLTLLPKQDSMTGDMELFLKMKNFLLSRSQKSSDEPFKEKCEVVFDSELAQELLTEKAEVLEAVDDFCDFKLNRVNIEDLDSYPVMNEFTIGTEIDEYLNEEYIRDIISLME